MCKLRNIQIKRYKSFNQNKPHVKLFYQQMWVESPHHCSLQYINISIIQNTDHWVFKETRIAYCNNYIGMELARFIPKSNQKMFYSFMNCTTNLFNQIEFSPTEKFIKVYLPLKELSSQVSTSETFLGGK